jgi:uncharacterized protein YebE (UPF0316 family)
MILYFFIGFLQDALATIDVLAINKNKPYISATIGFINTMLYGYVLFNFVIEKDFWLIFFYALGGWIGTVVPMKSKFLHDIMR